MTHPLLRRSSSAVNRIARDDVGSWIVGDGVRLSLPTFVEGLAQRLTALGLPIDRLGLSFGLLNPSLLAAGILWKPGEPIEYTRFDYAMRNSGSYERSPFKRAHETGQWVHIPVSETPDDAFGIVPDLKSEGYAHYYCIPLPSSERDVMSLTVATREAAGLSDAEKGALEELVPAIAMLAEIKTLRATFRDVLSAYVGREPARQILDGTIHRGEVTELRAAILVADLRGFTHLSTQLPPEATADVINAYYDVVVPPVTERGGEILKFIGDAILAVFPITDADDGPVLAALEAARAALDTDVAAHAIGDTQFPIRFGIAVHIGSAAYGNVGTGDRLDFTVIGRDVNVSARIASLCSKLGRDYLVSEEVARIGERAGRIMTDAGEFDVRGLEAPLRVFVPDVKDIGPPEDDGISQGLLLAPTA